MEQTRRPKYDVGSASRIPLEASVVGIVNGGKEVEGEIYYQVRLSGLGVEKVVEVPESLLDRYFPAGK